MDNFELDSGLASDCFKLGTLKGRQQGQTVNSLLLLLNNADYPWLVIVPMNTKVIDIDEMPEDHQLQILKDVNALSAFLKRHYRVDKINFASIGNIVHQLHFHLIARNKQDALWPSVVWGAKAIKKYTTDEVETLKNNLENEIDFFERI